MNKNEAKLFKFLWSPEIKNFPSRFVQVAFPWGKENTPLHRYKGPRTWQLDVFYELDEFLAKNIALPPDKRQPFKRALKSGRGIGKSSFVGMLSVWFMSCVAGSTNTVSANTEVQLQTKTLPEISKWFTLSRNSHWWDMRTLTVKPKTWYANALKQQLKIDTAYYYTKGVAWSKDSPMSFAGTHNDIGQGLIFDEASGISQEIYSVSNGFFTEKTPYRFWIAFSNPRKKSGAFYNSFQNPSWVGTRINGRDVPEVDQGIYDDILAANNGDEDSYDYRVEVLGKWPLQEGSTLIAEDLVSAAMDRMPKAPTAFHFNQYPLLLGVDPARFGDDKTTLVFRRGDDASTIPPQIYSNTDLMELADIILYQVQKYNPQSVVIDAGGGGIGVIDRLRQIKCPAEIVEVHGSQTAANIKYFNKRSELYGLIGDWLKRPEVCLPNHHLLREDLMQVHYTLKPLRGREAIALLPKTELKRMEFLGRSPDMGDALALTFAVADGSGTTTTRLVATHNSIDYDDHI